MKKLTIEIADLSDKDACALAIHKLFTALVDQHGETLADEFFLNRADLNGDRSRASAANREARVAFYTALSQLTHEDSRVVLENYAMPKPSKRGLAAELAEKNKNGEHFGRTGSTKADTLWTQIKRVFRENPKACRTIGEASAALREEAARRVLHLERFRAESSARSFRFIRDMALDSGPNGLDLGGQKPA